MIRSEGLEPNSEKFHEITYNVEPYINRIKRSCKKGKIIGFESSEKYNNICIF